VNTGASVAVTGSRDRLMAWLAHHRRVSVETIVGLLGNWVTSLMTWMVLGIALAMPVFLYLLLVNVSAVSEGFDGKPRISIYLKWGLPGDAANALLADLRANPNTDQAKYIDPESALVEFQSRSGFGDVLNTLERNPLPGVIELSPVNADPLLIRSWVAELEARSDVDNVGVDLAWIERLMALVKFGERLVLALSIVLALGVLLVVGNTIRLAIENRRSEIEVIKLVGGTDGFVRRPFLYLGFWYGIGGAIAALVLVQFALLFLYGPVEIIAQSYRNDFSLRGPGITDAAVLLLIGASLGILGATLAVSKHLHTIEPGGSEG
jgi:cell division transport system permease protein